MIDLKTRLEKAFRRVDIPKPENLEPFITYIDILTEWNRSIALISKREENIVNHLLAPSLLFFKFFREGNLNVIDIGSGAGFPAVVLKIYKPALNITMIEANGKKAAFLRYVCSKLNLNCNIINRRLEEIEPLRCDVISARAINLKPLLDVIKEKVEGDYLFYLTARENHLPLQLKGEIIFKNHCAKLYSL